MPGIVIGRDFEDLKKYGEKGTIFFGKHIVGTGEDAHLTSPVLIDVLRPHVICVSGKRGQGKSYSMMVFLEELSKLPEEIRNNLCALVVDTQGIFWTMKSPNEQQISLLNEWGLKPKGFDVHVLIPEGQKAIFDKADVNYDDVFYIMPNELTTEDWLNVFELSPIETEGIVLQRSLNRLMKDKKDYSIDDIIDYLKEEKGFEREKLVVENYLLAAKQWGVFGSREQTISELILQPGKMTILDVSVTPQNVRSLVVGLLSKQILEERVKARRKEEAAKIEETKIERTPMCWILVDEAHNFVPAEGKTPSSDIFTKIVKEGRQPGITTLFATQRPNKLHPDVLAQSDLVISYRLTAKSDIDALRAIMQTYILFDIATYFNELPRVKGAGLILDDNSERIYRIRSRPRQSWHAGSSPVAL